MLDEALLQQVCSIAHQAGAAILEVYQGTGLGIEHKQDATPVTVADIKANDIIVKGLSALPGSLPILSEESEHTAYQERKHWHRYWLVDPLDGTQEFINGNGQFTVNIALMEGQYPIFGMVYVPLFDTLYWGGKSRGAFKKVGDDVAIPIQSRPLDRDKNVVILGSRSYGTARAAAYVERLGDFFPQLIFKKVGSSLKSCLIAEGQADLYPRLGPTSEWDTAAPQAILEGAGGLLVDPAGERFKYNRGESLINPDFMVIGDKTLEWRTFWNESIESQLE